jgi:uncharacterized membrane protein YdfJ with MMPL/SSD domain
MEGLASFAYRRRRSVLIGAVVFFAVAGALGGSVAARLAPYGADDPATESVQAEQRLQDAGFRETAVIVLLADAPGDRRSTATRVKGLEGRLRSNPDVASVSGYYDTGSRDFVSRDGRTTYLAVALKPTDDKAWQDAANRIKEQLSGAAGVTVGGPAIAQQQVNKQVEQDLRRAEMLAFPLLFLLSLVFFRSLVASLLPLLVGALAIVGTFLLLRIASEIGSISVFALNLTTGLGLGLAIDYSLFVVSRYREELARSGPGFEAIRRTMATAGRTVLFSSVTVAAALASLLVFPQRFLYSMGLGGSLVALLAAAVALIVLPALLAVLGGRVNALSPRFLQRRAEREASSVKDGFWYRLAHWEMRRPIPVVVVTTTVLLALGIPFLGIKFTSPDAQILPKQHSARQVDDVLRAEFPPFRDSPIRILVEGGRGGSAAAAAQLTRELDRIGGIGEVQPPRRLANGDRLIQAISEEPYISAGSRDTVQAIRDLPEPAGTTVAVTGATAHFIDFQHSLSRHLPVAFAIIVVSTILVLFLMTGSVVLPVKQLLMNMLTLSAVFGILVWVFQDGRLEGPLGYRSQGALEQTMPILLFAVAFGLSTDYGVFLLSRIKEARDSGIENNEAVAVGLERTGRIVTAAALLFSIAIGAFATSEIVFIKQNGLGTALAVLIDALVIRTLLVPSLMALLGNWNWWAPRFLRRLYWRFGLSESAPRSA